MTNTEHDQRVAELLEANNREVERRRVAEHALARLREVLMRWQGYGWPDCGGDCASANPPVACCVMQETRAALTEPGGRMGGEAG